MRATKPSKTFLRCLGAACLLGALATPAYAAGFEYDANAPRCDAAHDAESDAAASEDAATAAPTSADGQDDDDKQEVDKEALRKKLQEQLRHRR